MKVIGITGGVGSGKSTVLKYLRNNYPCEVLVADDIGHEVQQKGQQAYGELVSLLGQEILRADGEIDRTKMAARMFGDSDLRKKCEGIVHPAVRERIEEGLKAAECKGIPVAFIEAALLVEAGYLEILDELWYIYADKSSRKTRLVNSRGYTEEKCESIMESQLSDEEFRENATTVIRNNGDVEETYRQIDECMGEYKWRV